jgi:hypothetical protein
MSVRPDLLEFSRRDWSAEALLDLLRDHPDWDESRRADVFDHLVAKYSTAQLHHAIQSRLADLGGGDGEAILRIVESCATPVLLRQLAEAVAPQETLAPERAWEALALLDQAGVLAEYPELAERFEELAEMLNDESSSLGELARQLESDPDGVSLALEGLAAIEPEIQSEIIRGLAREHPGPGVIELLTQLSSGSETTLRGVAVEALEGLGQTLQGDHALPGIAAVHADPSAARCERNHPPPTTELSCATSAEQPRCAGSLITSLDGEGRGYVVLVAERGDKRCAAAFLCDVRDGIREVRGCEGLSFESAQRFIAEMANVPDRDVAEGAHEVAIGLLSGSLLLNGPSPPPALRYWLERTVGPLFPAQRLTSLITEPDQAPIVTAEVARGAHAVLDSCPWWLDDSDLTYQLAAELLMRNGDLAPDPERDAGAYRFLFDHRLRDRLELDRRILLWMGAFWRALSEHDLADASLRLARELDDTQHAVPGHPFLQALATRSLALAQANLRAGVDLRDPATRQSRRNAVSVP